MMQPVQVKQEVKQEIFDYVDIETKIIELCKANPKGITDANIQSVVGGIPAQQRVTAVNRLLSIGQLELLRNGQTLYYRYKDSQAAGKTKGFEQEEKLIYQMIEDAGNIGIWIRDLRYKCGLQLAQVNKFIKNLESKKFIKAVTSVAAGKKKVYMLYNLEPDASVTGGAWYSNQDFESEFVDILNQQCDRFLQEKRQLADEGQGDPLFKRDRSYASLWEVWNYIKDLGISKVQLSLKDIEAIMNTLIFDGKVESQISLQSAFMGSGPSTEETVEQTSASRKLYRSIKPILPVPGIMRVPCGVCPVMKNCYPGGEVSPEKCVYMKEWLDI